MPLFSIELAASENSRLERRKPQNEPSVVETGKGQVRATGTRFYVSANGYLASGDFEQNASKLRNVHKESPIVKFFQNNRNRGWNTGYEEFKDEKGLIGHLAAYQTAFAFADNSDFYQHLDSHFGDSPLLLALADQRVAQTQKIDTLLDLNKRPQWSGLAKMMCLQVMQQTAKEKQKFAKEFWRWRDEFKKSEAFKAGYDVMLNAEMAALLEEVESKPLRAIIDERFEGVIASGSLAALLNFAEQANSWGRLETAKSALEFAETKLSADKSLLSQLAMGQAYWICGKPEQALAKYELILQSLQEKKIAASPALLATVSRIASQAGESKRAIDLEEQALAIEQKYLPQLVNLNAFNARYNWLWSQYQQAIETAKAANEKEEIKSISARAYEIWMRWQEVDYQHLHQPTYIVTLLKLAGADDQEIWAALSTPSTASRATLPATPR